MTQFTYYAERDGLIKIGLSSDPATRIRKLKGAVLLVQEPAFGGGFESVRHRQFAHAHAGGEWFRPVPELLAHIESLREINTACGGGEPFARRATPSNKPALRIDPQRLVARRLLAGKSQADIALALATNQPHISRIERGKQTAGPRTIKRLADALGCDPLDIATLEMATAS